MSLQQCSEHLQKQLSSLKVKYQQEIKKNNNLLKMNSNLMKENDLYQNCFGMLKGWGARLLRRDKEGEEEEESCLDIQEEGEQFVRALMQEVDARVLQLQQLKIQLERLKSDYNYRQPNTNDNTRHPNPPPCPDCTRWKQLYLKQTKQTQRLQHLITSTQQLKHQKQLNFIKLKDDIKVLLEDYWGLYREKVRVGAEGNEENKREDSRRETVRSGGRSKEKRTERSGSKGKKVVSIAVQDKVLQGNNTNSNNLANLNSNSIGNKTSNNPTTAFSKQKQKTTRPSPKCYSITLPNPKQPQPLPQQLSSSIQSILSSYSHLSTSLQDQNCLLKQQLLEQNQILLIYRQKERHRMLGR